ncbi:hypothetical protein ABZ865_41765 [Streptomyces sp. NPDC047085]|uniref:hypothetical protein n=1 Tax=Streptomyces sp. NPDC047085 TaxID=3155140 RepID=UPI0033DF4835
MPAALWSSVLLDNRFWFSPTHPALLEFPAQGVESVLRETWSVVPPGAESSRVDLDAELAQLLAEN